MTLDPTDHVVAGLMALEGTITERTETLIALHMEAHQYRAGTLGARGRLRLEHSDDFEDLLLLQDLDKRGRVPGAVVCELEEALDVIRALAQESEE